MTPDDPRHGSQAGAVAHWRSGERPCGPCRDGALRAKKRRQLAELSGGESATVRLGEAAHTIIATTNRTHLAAGTGLGQSQLRLYQVSGPDKRVRRGTRDKILAYRRQWTPVGIQRRLRALTLLGWSMQAIADRSGIYMTSLAEMRRNEDIKFVRREVAEKILAVWGDLCMTPAPDSHSARETSARATGRGWVPGLAWDDIDDPGEKPKHHARGTSDPAAMQQHLDMAVVWRLVDDAIRVRKLTSAEAREAYRILAARGLSGREIEEHYGLNAVRYTSEVA